VRLSGDDLQKFTTKLVPLPDRVEPLLSLVEEVVLLSLGSSRIRAHHVAGIAADAHPDTPHDYHAAMSSLTDRGLMTHTGLGRAPVATPSARIRARHTRVSAIIRRPAPPQAADAELIALLAAARTLRLQTAKDHMAAHTRVASIGHDGLIPPAVIALADELRTTTMSELADRLLPPTRDDLCDASVAGRANLSAALTYGAGSWC
jgi:hypothetical protein